ncbi:MAG: alpha/beta hydrolase [Beijerinckiaceae bacterium]|nr:alpha/beta hydrolase [Beijerinckiaceae bacterium]
MAIRYPITGIGILNSLASATGLDVTCGVRYREGQRGLLDVYAPKEASGAPTVVFFYGGGWESGERADYRFAAAALAKRGFVVAVPDYRVYPEARYPDFLIDGAKAVRWARRHAGEFGGDPGLLFLTGHSAGAYIAAMLALDTRWLDGESLAALAGVVGLAGPYDFLPLRGQVLNDVFAPAGDLASSQPITYARANAAPLLLLSGVTDKTVSPGNSRRLAGRIRALGGEAEARFYPHANHVLILGSFSPLLRPVAPALHHTASFITARAGNFRPKPGSPHFFRTTPLP